MRAVLAAALVLAGCATSTTSAIPTVRPCGAVTYHFDLDQTWPAGMSDSAGRLAAWVDASGAASAFLGAGFPHRPRADRRPPHPRPATFLSGRRPAPSADGTSPPPSGWVPAALWCVCSPPIAPSWSDPSRRTPSADSRKELTNDQARQNPPAQAAMEREAAVRAACRLAAGTARVDAARNRQQDEVEAPAEGDRVSDGDRHRPSLREFRSDTEPDELEPRLRPWWQDCPLVPLDHSGPRRVPPRAPRRLREHLEALAMASVSDQPQTHPEASDSPADERTTHVRHPHRRT